MRTDLPSRLARVEAAEKIATQTSQSKDGGVMQQRQMVVRRWNDEAMDMHPDVAQRLQTLPDTL